MPSGVYPRELEPERRVMQTRMHNPPESRGDCTECCVATLLGISRAELGYWDNGDNVAFWDAFDEAFSSRGLMAVRFEGTRVFDAIYLASGKSPRGTNHMVLLRNGKLVHDPHPDGTGVVAVDYVWIVAPRDVAQARVRELEAENLYGIHGELSERFILGTATEEETQKLETVRACLVTMKLRYPYDGWNKGWLNADTDGSIGWLPLPATSALKGES